MDWRLQEQMRKAQKESEDYQKDLEKQAQNAPVKPEPPAPRVEKPRLDSRLLWAVFGASFAGAFFGALFFVIAVLLFFSSMVAAAFR